LDDEFTGFSAVLVIVVSFGIHDHNKSGNQADGLCGS